MHGYGLAMFSSCNLVDSLGGVNLSWLLYYLARPQIVVEMDHIKNKLNDFLATINLEEPFDPVKILQQIYFFDIMSRYL